MQLIKQILITGKAEPTNKPTNIGAMVLRKPDLATRSYGLKSSSCCCASVCSPSKDAWGLPGKHTGRRPSQQAVRIHWTSQPWWSGTRSAQVLGLLTSIACILVSITAEESSGQLWKLTLKLLSGSVHLAVDSRLDNLARGVSLHLCAQATCRITVTDARLVQLSAQ